MHRLSLASSPADAPHQHHADNIAPPVAACLGDLVTLLLLGAVSTINIVLIDTPLAFIILICLSTAAVGWTILTRRNAPVRHLLLEGWVPLFAAMIISCGTGIVLDLFVSRYDGFALLAAVIGGMPSPLPCCVSSHADRSSLLQASRATSAPSSSRASRRPCTPHPWL